MGAVSEAGVRRAASFADRMDTLVLGKEIRSEEGC